MKAYFDQSDLAEAVNSAMYCVSTRNTIAAVECILIRCEEGRAILSSFDLEKGITIVIPAEVEEHGACVLNAQNLNSIIRLMPSGKVSLEVNENFRAKVSSGKSEFEINSLNPVEFPTIPDLPTGAGFNIKQGDMKSMIAQTLFAVAQNDARATFNGALFKINGKRITTVGCDSYRLAVREKVCELENKTDSELDIKFIIPGRTLSELLKLLSDPDEDVNISINQKQALFRFREKNTIFYTRLIEGEYIDYERIIPKNSSIFVDIDRASFETSLSRASLVSDDSTGKNRSFAKCFFHDNCLEISSISTSGKVRDEIVTSHDGADIEIGFNCRYLMEALKASNSTALHLSMSSPFISMVIEPIEINENDKFLFLVLPIKMK